MSEYPCTTLWCDYYHTQVDPAHVLSELGFSIVFEILQAVVIYVLWRKFIKPRWFAKAHIEFDEEHGLTHKGDHRVGDSKDLRRHGASDELRRAVVRVDGGDASYVGRHRHTVTNGEYANVQLPTDTSAAA